MDKYLEPKCTFCGAPHPPDGWTVVVVPAHANIPGLEPSPVADLGDAPELSGWPKVVEYGATLAEVFAQSRGDVNDFLIRASLAGHAPSDTDGICVALRALHANRLADAERFIENGADGDAIYDLDAGEFRKVISLLERLTADLEQRAWALWSAEPPGDVPADVQALWRRLSDAAEERAMNALKRGLEVEQDTSAAAAAWEWRP